ncbi:hypothetical protein Ga0466249_005026 [Sporomusaceae bacterium BoRhaA]|uniref:hypothetical protein n=1 Tax=Pelorhabdus rhamnosifermentans TaxID=2772457 RepID=UPI001C062716|nr:hypothetical protein [Pelorhabdus rhamnosifermentans]MBU2703876.1 hypothetical protein [Pelorhabdus rhamnosifermentans]
MKNKIPFEAFGEKQEVCFTITGIAELERTMGKSVQQIISSGDAGVSFCLAALPIALKRLNPHIYLNKIETFLENGGDINELAAPLVAAIAASGVLGQTYVKNAMAMYYPDLYKEESDEETKNA